MEASERPALDERSTVAVGDALLDATGVSKRFGGLLAVDSVSFSIPRRSIVSIIGPNGAGKTTFFNMLTGLYKPTTGRITFDGRNITGVRPDRIMNRGMARTFQNIRLFGTMTSIENVMVSQHGSTRAGLFRSILRTPGQRKEERGMRDKAREVLSYVGLRESVFEEISVNLSYGDQRRLEIARALASDPMLLLLDEPTAGMNPQESARLTDFMQRLRDERGLTILLIEHDMKVVMGVSERITVLDHGEKIAEGDPQEVRENERVIEAYLGKQSDDDGAAKKLAPAKPSVGKSGAAAALSVERVQLSDFTGSHSALGIEVRRAEGGDAVYPASTRDAEEVGATFAGVMTLLAPDKSGKFGTEVEGYAVYAFTDKRLFGVLTKGRALGEDVDQSGGDDAVAVFSVERGAVHDVDIERDSSGVPTRLGMIGKSCALAMEATEALTAAHGFESSDNTALEPHIEAFVEGTG
jgi:branched-chain amino acid transport system ATP-binding protein